MVKVEKVLKALSDRNRLRIVNMLTEKPMCVCEITEVLRLGQSTVSGHLRVLKEAELAEDVKSGLWVEYHLRRDREPMARILDVILASLAGDRQLAEDRVAALRVDRAIICKK